MAIGPLLRSWMTPRLERRLSGIYRSVFVDLDVVAAEVAKALPGNARLLDIGGGDGELLNRLFALRPDVRVTMVDIAATVGKFVEPAYRAWVECLPGTSLEGYLATSPQPYEAVLVSDVIHHLPLDYRPGFLRALGDALGKGGVLLIKDIEPGHPIAALSLWCDRYVSGDRGVALMAGEDLRALAEQVLPPHSSAEVGLLQRAAPNYLFKFQLEAA